MLFNIWLIKKWIKWDVFVLYIIYWKDFKKLGMNWQYNDYSCDGISNFKPFAPCEGMGRVSGLTEISYDYDGELKVNFEQWERPRGLLSL